MLGVCLKDVRAYPRVIFCGHWVTRSFLLLPPVLKKKKINKRMNKKN